MNRTHFRISEMIFCLTLCALPFAFFLWLRRSVKGRLPLPPGPKGYPFIGNMLDMPTVTPWKVFQEWCKVYGDVIYLDLPGRPTIVLGSVKVAVELLEKRSSIYSDRAVFVTDKLLSWDFNFAFMPYSQTWRNHRRAFHQYFNQGEVHKYHPIQVRECRAFLQRMLDSPENIAQHVRQIYTAIILKIVYDMEVTGMNCEYVLLAQEAMMALNIARVTEASWVEYLPILKHIPSWVPGARFKKLADRFRPVVETMRDKPFNQIKRDVANGKGSSSVSGKLLKRLQDRFGETELNQEQEEIARNVAGIAYAAAADTTTSAAQSFFVAMSLYPDVQRKAQAELDRVVGPDRLPDFNHLDELVYIQAVALETMRWAVVTPLANPHRLLRDDEFNGFFIPKDEFKPERFIKDEQLDPNVRSPLSIAFGFGRRICPGRHLSGSSLFLTIASVLHTLSIQPALGQDGKTIDPSTMMSTGIISSPKCVPCIVNPRSANAEHLIRHWNSTASE
ncbi:unnamed protein product [Somion occarium]|uniref:Cytochrome P450 n=1 Tax=Somion occarium TaxID=3059160 RepID=A0ABP1DSW8_9APHY